MIYVVPHWFPPTAGRPRHRVIVAVDIEQSTSRPDPVKAELRRALYDLFNQALRSAGIHGRHRDRFIDRGDGLLALIRPAGQAAKPIVLNHAIPALDQLLASHNASLASTGRLHEQFRIRVVVHAGIIHYDNNGCFGEALDIAFRLLDAPGVKEALRTTAAPLSLVISDEIYRAVVRHGYAGTDFHAFRPLVTVHIAGHCHPGWIRASRQTTGPHLTEIAGYEEPAQYQSRGRIA